MSIRRLSLAMMALAASVGADLCVPMELAYNGSGFAWATSPGTYAPRYNQRKARRDARRTNRKVVR